MSTLVLEIEVPNFNVDGAQQAADEFYDGDVFHIVIEEWMRKDVVLSLVSIPGEKEQNHDFELHGMAGRIVGAKIHPLMPNNRLTALEALAKADAMPADTVYDREKRGDALAEARETLARLDSTSRGLAS